MPGSSPTVHRCVGDVMTRAVVTADAATPYKELVRVMTKQGISAVPVVDGQAHPVGIVSEADLLLKPAAPERALISRLQPGRHRAERKAEGVTAADLMSSPVITVGPATPVALAARLMHRHGVKRLPVVDGDGRLVGIASRVDLLKPFLRSDDEIRDEVAGTVLRRWMSLDPSAVAVQVTDGEVTLSGTVERRSDVNVISALVAGLDGVVDVDNRAGFIRDDVHDHQTRSEARVR